jgi:folate-binding protein YgfZ
MLRRSPLFETQKASGASFIALFGWEIAETFTSLDQEYEALCKISGLLDCSQSGLIEVKGDDRVRFLHGMLTNDIRKLLPGNGCYAAFLTPQGRLVADMRVYSTEDSLLVMCDPSLREKVPPALRKYIIGDRPELIDRSEDLAVLSIQGSSSARVLKELSPAFSPLDQSFDHREFEVLGLRVRVCRVNRILYDGYDLIVPVHHLAKLWNGILEYGGLIGIRPVGFKALNIHRVEAGIPWYAFDMDEKTLPLEAGLDKNAISLTKGCYIGQESVARITYRGQVHRKLAGLAIMGDNVAASGDKILKESQEVGWITSSVFSKSLEKPIALGYLRQEVLEPGTALRVEHSNATLEATVSSLPFIRN